MARHVFYFYIKTDTPSQLDAIEFGGCDPSCPQNQTLETVLARSYGEYRFEDYEILGSESGSHPILRSKDNKTLSVFTGTVSNRASNIIDFPISYFLRIPSGSGFAFGQPALTAPGSGAQVPVSEMVRIFSDNQYDYLVLGFPDVENYRAVVEIYLVPRKTVSFITSCGTLVDGYATYTEGVSRRLPTVDVPTGKLFSGWYATAEFSGNSMTEIPASATGDLVFYARFIDLPVPPAVREDGVKRFWFRVVRGVGSFAIHPGASPVLRFANMSPRTLELPDLPQGLVQAGDAIEVRYGTSEAQAVTVFTGTLEKRVESFARGIEVRESATFADAWSVLERLVYRQEWRVAGADGTATLKTSTSNVVLNCDAVGRPISMTAQIQAILDFAGGASSMISCGAGGVDAGTQVLPADPTSNITCATAIARTLRFFPKVMACCTDGGSVRVWTPSSADAPWIAGARILSRTKTHTAHPVVGVDIATDAVDVEASGAGGFVRISSHQTAGVVDSVDTLHVFLPLASGSSSSSWETLDCRGHLESLSEFGGWQSIGFWIAHHPRLEGLDNSKVRTTSGPEIVSGTEYAYITDIPVETLRHFGLQASILHLKCKVTVDVDAETQENVLLTMDFVTTNARPRTYTQSTGSSSSAGESLPDGLAQAILDQRSGSLIEEEMSIRLGDRLPSIGDAVDGLYLQNFSVDCYDLTARLHFGHPDYLSAEDMRALLSGFRDRAYSRTAPNRDSEDTSDGQDQPQEGDGIKPIKVTEFSPGTYRKLVIKPSDGEHGGIDLDSTGIARGETMAVRTLKIPGASGSEKEVKFLTTGLGEGSGGQNVTLVSNLEYDKSTHKLTYKPVKGTFMDGLVVLDADENEPVEVFEAVEHTRGMD